MATGGPNKELDGVPIRPIPRVVGVLETRADNERLVFRRAFKQRPKALTEILPAVDCDSDSKVARRRCVDRRHAHKQQRQAYHG